MQISSKVMSMEKGWVVEYENGSVVTEYDSNGEVTDWKKIPKVGIKSVSLKWHDRHWTLSGKKIYLQFKRAFISPVSSEVQIVERCVGYWEGPDKVVYRVDEATGHMKIAVEGPK